MILQMCNTKRCYPYAIGMFDECNHLSEYLSNLAYWTEICECGRLGNYHFVKTAQKVLKQTREKFVVINRQGNDANTDDDEKYSYNFSNTNWGKKGLTRFSAHNIMEIACDSLLYVIHNIPHVFVAKLMTQ